MKIVCTWDVWSLDMIPNIHVTEGNNEKTKFNTWKCVGGGKKILLSGGIKSNSRIYDESKTGRENNNTRGVENKTTTEKQQQQQQRDKRTQQRLCKKLTTDAIVVGRSSHTSRKQR
jgi:hypothetical protein